MSETRLGRLGLYSVCAGSAILAGMLFIGFWPKQVASLEFDLGQLSSLEIPAGEKQYLSFDVSNPCIYPVRIVGLGLSCGLQGCIESFEPETCTLAPGDVRSIRLLFKSPDSPGPIDLDFWLHFAADETHRTMLSIRALHSKLGRDLGTG